MTDPTKTDPKLAAGVERLRNGTSSLTTEAKTQGITYASLQGALKKELGVAGYGALLKANHKAAGAAKPKVTKPKAAKAAGKKRSRKAKK